ncbi:putative tetratricopeptide-like helical domain-containing protein [Rosa chinensis]|uniref:Putative tetratricopeptide-like helical domain-containing protein n=1 Tax=Rosa chinensis TaxID=74649 RepID=A0A2P6QUZ3_ROSCH|nr:putative pentatricopeptide repeat-containing protein At5g08310, mitochondrial [Rosa chinensis]PRQ37998.1 putative tetratricopeptide-like helical domain-containing protein [Rosa chinensis]
MALPRISKTHQNLWKSINPINPTAFFSLIFTNIHTPSSNSPRPICTKTHSDPFLPNPDVGHVADGLISIFTKQPFSPDNPDLKHFASRITPKAVECVLNGLKSWKLAQLFFTWASNQCGYKHNCYTYNAMASHLSRARQNAPMRALAMEVVDSNCYMTPGALGFFLRCLGSVQLVEEANILFDQVCTKGLCVPNSYSYNCLLEAISKSGSIELLEKRMKEMGDSGLEFDRYTLTAGLKVYCNAGKFEKALNVYNEMHEKRWVDAHAVSILVLHLSKSGEVDKAFDLIERMERRNLGLNDKTFRVLIHGFVRESRVDKALQLFDKMRKSGFSVDVSIYDVLIGGLCKNREIEKALSMYSEMKDLGIHSDVRVLTKLILACSDEREMIQMLEESQEHLNEEDMLLLCSSVLNSLVTNDSIDRAYRLLQAMMKKESDADPVVKKKVRPTTRSFEIVIDGLLKFGKLAVALSLLEDMNQIGCKPNVVIYNNVIDELCKSNRLEESYKLLREMEQSGVEPTHFTHNLIYGCHCRREDVQGALNLVKEMRVCGHEPWKKHSTLLVKQLCEHGKAAEACNFLDKMVEVSFVPRLVSYSAVISGLLKIQEVDRALQLFQDICADGYCPDVVFYNIMINGLCKAKRVSEAENFLKEMVRKGLVPSVVTYNLLINGYCKNDDVDKAMTCLSRIFDEAREPNVITYTTLIDGLCNAGRIDDALVLWNDMAKKGCAPNRIAFMALINGLCKCGKPAEALAYLREMEEKEMKPGIRVYSAITSALISNLNIPPAT